jgi:hypothetical protein
VKEAFGVVLIPRFNYPCFCAVMAVPTFVRRVAVAVRLGGWILCQREDVVLRAGGRIS